jgi:hypothetical protein
VLTKDDFELIVSAEFILRASTGVCSNEAGDEIRGE